MNVLVEVNSQYYFQSFDPNNTIAHIGTTYYIPRVNSFPTISRTVGSTYFGVNTIDSVSITLKNEDGYFDDIYSNFFNKSVTIKIGTGNNAIDYLTIFTGRVSAINKTMKKMTLTCSDVKHKLNINMVFSYYSTATYANLNTKNVNKPIPQMWGQNVRMSCICTNEMESPTPTNYTFKICDTTYNVLTSIDAVYMDDVAVTYANTNLTNATFTIAAATLGTNNFDKITASATNAMNNPVNIIQDIVDTAIAGFSWDTLAMAQTALEGFVTSYYQNSVVDVLTAINEIMNDTNLIMVTSTSGVSKLKYFDITRSVTRVIKNHEYTDEFSVDNNINEYASSVLITYLPSRSSESKKYHRVSTYSAMAQAWFGEAKEITVNTNLISTTDAEFKAEVILYLANRFRETYTRSIRLDIHDDIQPLDFVAADPSKRDINVDTGIYDTYEVLGVVDDYGAMTKTLTLRYISGYAYINNFAYLTDHNNANVTDHNEQPIMTGDY